MLPIETETEIRTKHLPRSVVSGGRRPKPKNQQVKLSDLKKSAAFQSLFRVPSTTQELRESATRNRNSYKSGQTADDLGPQLQDSCLRDQEQGSREAVERDQIQPSLDPAIRCQASNESGNTLRALLCPSGRNSNLSDIRITQFSQLFVTLKAIRSFKSLSGTKYTIDIPHQEFQSLIEGLERQVRGDSRQQQDARGPEPTESAAAMSGHTLAQSEARISEPHLPASLNDSFSLQCQFCSNMQSSCQCNSSRVPSHQLAALLARDLGRDASPDSSVHNQVNGSSGNSIQRYLGQLSSDDPPELIIDSFMDDVYSQAVERSVRAQEQAQVPQQAPPENPRIAVIPVTPISLMEEPVSLSPASMPPPTAPTTVTKKRLKVNLNFKYKAERYESSKFIPMANSAADKRAAQQNALETESVQKNLEKGVQTEPILPCSCKREQREECEAKTHTNPIKKNPSTLTQVDAPNQEPKVPSPVTSGLGINDQAFWAQFSQYDSSVTEQPKKSGPKVQQEIKKENVQKANKVSKQFRGLDKEDSFDTLCSSTRARSATVKTANNKQAAIEAKLKAQKDARLKGEIDLIFLHASPNLIRKVSKSTDGMKERMQYSQHPALDFLREAETIKAALRETGRQIVYESKVATRDSFEEMIRKKPKVLHISCHGLRKRVKPTMGLNHYQQRQDEGHFLLFENAHGDGELVSAQTLSTFMQQSEHEVELVFVAACDSQDIGRIFQRNGARHVVCVEQNRFVLDEAAIEFTKTFYSLLFKGEQTVCRAFKAAKNSVSFKIQEDEADLFMMLLQEDDSQEQIPGIAVSPLRHVCNSFDRIDEGKFECQSEHNLIKYIPAKLGKFDFRQKDMSTLLESMISKRERIVPLLGLHGIGKSSLARNALHFVAERKVFSGGILNIQLKEIQTTFDMLLQIMRALMRNLVLTDDERRSLTDRTCSNEGLLDYFVQFFNQEQPERLKKRKKIGLESRKRGNKNFLLCLNDASHIIRDEREEFVHFLAEMYDQCPELYIIVTSDRDFGRLPTDYMTKPILVQQLSQTNSVKLFLDNCGEVTPLQIYELILADAQFPIKRFLPSYDADVGLTDQIKRTLRQKVNDTEAWVSMLSLHDMFRHLQGNPTSIMIVASILGSPVRQQDRSHQQTVDTGRALAELYEQMKDESSAFKKTHDFGQDGKQMPFEIENIMSLKVAAEMNVKLLDSIQPKAKDLLFLLGCLPGGVTREQLSKMWTGSGDELSNSIGYLLDLRFVEMGAEKVVLTPTMQSHTCENVEPESVRDNMQIVCAFYKGLLDESYRQIGKVDDLNQVLALPLIPLDGKSLPKGLSHKVPSTLKKESSSLILLTEQKVQFEVLNSEMENLQNCINFLVEYCTSHADDAELSRIKSNFSFSHSKTLGAKSMTTPLTSDIDLDSELLDNQQESFQQQPLTPSETSQQEQIELLLHKRRPQGAGNGQTLQVTGGQKHSQAQVPTSMRRQSTRITVKQQVSPLSSKLNRRKSIKIANPDFCRKFQMFITNVNLHQIKEDEDQENASQHKRSDRSSKGGKQDSEVNQTTNDWMNALNEFGESQVRLLDWDESDEREQSSDSSSLDSKANGSDQEQEGLKQVQSAPPKQLMDSMKSCGLTVMQLSGTEEKQDQELESQADDFLSELLGNIESKAGFMLGHRSTMQARPSVPLAKQRNKRRASVKVVGDNKFKWAKQITQNELSQGVSVVDQFNRKTKERQLVERKACFHRKSKVSSFITEFLSEGSSTAPQRQKSPRSLQRSMRDLNPVTIWTPTSVAGSFILAFVAVSYLCNSFESSLRIATTDFSYLANSALFEGNILRFRALASLKLFQHSLEAGPHELQQAEFSLLTTAIASLQNAQAIFEAREVMLELEKNHYGLGLTLFTLGYLYESFGEHLSVANKPICDTYHTKYLLDGPEESRERAIGYYRQAYSSLAEVGHIAGLFLCKSHEASLLPNASKAKSLAQNKAERLQQVFEDYSKTEGLEKSCYIPREQGSDTSLMVEIVYSLPRRDCLFPQSTQAIVERPDSEEDFLSTDSDWSDSGSSSRNANARAKDEEAKQAPSRAQQFMGSDKRSTFLNKSITSKQNEKRLASGLYYKRT